MAQEESDLRRLHAATNRLFWCATSSWAAMGLQKGQSIARVEIKASDLANAVKQHLTETLLAQQLYLSEDVEDVVAAHAAFLKAVAAHTSRLSAGAVQQALHANVQISHRLGSLFANEMVKALSYVKSKGDKARNGRKMSQTVASIYNAMVGGQPHETELPAAKKPKTADVPQVPAAKPEDEWQAKINAARAIYSLPQSGSSSSSKDQEVLQRQCSAISICSSSPESEVASCTCGPPREEAYLYLYI